jgi:hypothetical protein
MIELGSNPFLTVKKKEKKEKEINKIDKDGLKNCWHFYSD